MAIDINSYRQKAATGTLATSRATGGSGGPKVPSGQYITKIKAATMGTSQAGQPLLSVDFIVKQVVEVTEPLEEGVTETTILGRDFRTYFSCSDKVEADADWAERLIGDVVAICRSSGIDPEKIFKDADGDDAKSVKAIFLNFAQVASRMLAKGADMGEVSIKRVRQLKDATRFDHEFKSVAAAPAPAKKSAATEGL